MSAEPDVPMATRRQRVRPAVIGDSEDEADVAAHLLSGAAGAHQAEPPEGGDLPDGSLGPRAPDLAEDGAYANAEPPRGAGNRSGGGPTPGYDKAEACWHCRSTRA